MLTQEPAVYIFGEVLFYCFPDAAPVLGGAPFNVAWHLNAFGANTNFISAVGEDDLGNKTTQSMQEWGLGTEFLQQHPHLATGTIDVHFEGSEPHYTINEPVAFDSITGVGTKPMQQEDIFYHGSLALRHENNQQTLAQWLEHSKARRFIDVNLRDPWWTLDILLATLQYATCVKLNSDELRRLSHGDAAHNDDTLLEHAAEFRRQNNIVNLLVTRGEQGAILIDGSGKHYTAGPPPQSSHFIDAMGAGDAFSAVTLLGLIHDWSWPTTLARAQEFASFIVTQRGATCSKPDIYDDFLHFWGMR